MNQNYSNQPPRYTHPVGQLDTNRDLVKFIVLSIITCGIYAIVFYSGISTDINVIASRYDGKRTMHFCLLYFVLAPVTCGIAGFVWHHQLSNRIGKELERRGINYQFSASTYWLWNILGAFIIVGPFIYTYKLIKAMNSLANNYNVNG